MFLGSVLTLVLASLPEIKLTVMMCLNTQHVAVQCQFSQTYGCCRFVGRKVQLNSMWNCGVMSFVVDTVNWGHTGAE